MEEGRSTLKILTGEPTGKDLKEIGINMMNWVDLAQDSYYSRTLVNAAFNLRVP